METKTQNPVNSLFERSFTVYDW